MDSWAATNDYFHCWVIGRLFSSLIVLSVFTEMSWIRLFCSISSSKPNYIQFTVIYDKDEQQILSFSNAAARKHSAFLLEKWLKCYVKQFQEGFFVIWADQPFKTNLDSNHRTTSSIIKTAEIYSRDWSRPSSLLWVSSTSSVQILFEPLCVLDSILGEGRTVRSHLAMHRGKTRAKVNIGCALCPLLREP